MWAVELKKKKKCCRINHILINHILKKRKYYIKFWKMMCLFCDKRI